ncbi:MAG: glutathione S-transferase family protein [Myxococcales bacterium]|nr:glutathione S-transferase family protein [Myxococcales bacterium]
MTPPVLYAMPFGCSMAVHLALRQRGITPRIRWLVGRGPRLLDGGDFREVNPKGKVAALLLDGRLITENVAVLLAVAELGGPRYDRLAEAQWLTFVATELHKQVLYPSFDPGAPPQTRDDVLKRLLPPVLSHVEDHLGERPYLLGEEPSVADDYLYWALLMVRFLRVAVGPTTQSYSKRLHLREVTAPVMAIEEEARQRVAEA